jgi:hypothetical protein
MRFEDPPLSASLSYIVRLYLKKKKKYIYIYIYNYLKGMKQKLNLRKYLLDFFKHLKTSDLSTY